MTITNLPLYVGMLVALIIRLPIWSCEFAFCCKWYEIGPFLTTYSLGGPIDSTSSEGKGLLLLLTTLLAIAFSIVMIFSSRESKLLYFCFKSFRFTAWMGPKKDSPRNEGQGSAKSGICDFVLFSNQSYWHFFQQCRYSNPHPPFHVNIGLK